MTLRGVEILRELWGEHSDRLRFALDYAQGCSQLSGILKAQGDTALSDTWLQEAIPVAELVLNRRPDSDEAAGVLANFRMKFGQSLAEQGKHAQAIRVLAEVIPEQIRLYNKHPHDSFRYEFALVALRVQAWVLFSAEGKADGHIALTEFALGNFERNKQLFRNPDWLRRFFGDTCQQNTVALLDYLGQYARADEYRGRHAAVRQYLDQHVGDVPEIQYYHALALVDDGHSLWTRDPKRAHEAFQRAAGLLAPKSPENATNVNRSMHLQVELLASCPDPKVRDPARALKLSQTLKTDRLFDRAAGIAHFENGNYEQARVHLSRFLLTKPQPDPSDIRPRAFLAMSFFQLGDHPRAKSELSAIENDLRQTHDVPWALIRYVQRAWWTILGQEMPDLCKRPAPGEHRR